MRRCETTDIDECTADENLCADGDCINTEGGVRCECPKGFVLSADGKQCVDVREELCFNNFLGGGVCSEPRLKAVTQSQCCCTMGQAWGNSCEKCPAEDSGKKFLKNK